MREGAWPRGALPARLPRRIRRALVLAALLGTGTVLLWWGASGVGQWLMVADPLEPAKAVVVLSGRVPSRAIEAASREAFGLMNVWAGFPVQPDRSRR